MKKIFLWSIVGFALVSCQQDPYGGKPVNGAPPPKIGESPKNDGADGLQAETFMQFSEGNAGEYLINASVEGKGSPVLQFDNLPTGAKYDPATGKLTWTPNFQAANDPRDPAILVRDYFVKIRLFSSLEPATARKTLDVVMNVKDTPMPASVKSSLNMTGHEGQPLVHQIDFVDQEYPNGPFQIALDGLPADAELVWPDKRVPSFTFKWTPAYDRIVNQSSQRFSVGVVIYNPRGKRLDFKVWWDISNETVEPLVAGPDSVAQPGDLDFIVMAEDPNGEMAPEWTASTPPPYGFFTVTSQALAGTGHPKSMGIVSWKAVPKDKLGVVLDVVLSACVDGWACSYKTVKLLPLKPPPSPPQSSGGGR